MILEKSKNLPFVCFPVQRVTRHFEGNKIFTLNGLTAIVSFNANQETAMAMVAMARVNIVQNRQAYIRKNIAKGTTDPRVEFIFPK